MANLFSTDSMASGYATSRPAVHPVVMGRVYGELGRNELFQRALDVGCGAGVSTRALSGVARNCVGLEPMEAMLKWAAKLNPAAGFVVGTAEALPMRDKSVDLITAAGSLNYANLDQFFPEAKRVLMPGGVLVVYDFSAGRSFRDTTSLDEWFSHFQSRYPPPASEARKLNPQILEEVTPGFRLGSHESFEIGLVLARSFYLDYMMTETNVAAAIRKGVPELEIRSWCEETLSAVWDLPEREVLFRGYFACMSAV